MRFNPATDRYVPVSWDEAFALIGRELRALDDPNEAEFYTSGRTSNEAAFLYQLFARLYGTNNFPDCSNMCHEPTSVGLPESIGIGKGTVVLEDFEHADAIFILGQNPGTNSPRMMTELHNASRRGAPIIVFNPLKERALERFAAPQDPIEMATFGSTRIASEYCQVRVGGDAAALKGIIKLVLEADDAARAAGQPPVLDTAFIAEHTDGFEAFAADIRQTAWDDILSTSGLPREQLERVARVYMQSKAVIACYGMGMTQHRLGTDNVQQLVNLLFLARQYRQARRRHLSGARALERAGGPDGRDRREAEAGIPRSAGPGVRLRPAPRPRSQRRPRRRGHAGRPGQGVHRHGGQLRRCGARQALGSGGHAQSCASPSQ